MLFDFSAECDLFVDLGAYGAVQLKFSQVHFDGGDTCTRAERTNVQHEYFSLLQSLHTSRLLLAVRADTQQTPQQERADLNVGEYLRQRIDRSQGMTHHTIGTT